MLFSKRIKVLYSYVQMNNKNQLVREILFQFSVAEMIERDFVLHGMNA